VISGKVSENSVQNIFPSQVLVVNHYTTVFSLPVYIAVKSGLTDLGVFTRETY
jgi:hypothetical protein